MPPVTYLFIAPRGQLMPEGFGQMVGLVAYLFTCTLIIGFGEAARLARNRSSKQGELLRVTLRSIGDAVITTDVGGRVTDFNAVAEAVTGWTRREAIGQPLDAVFRIINEHTRQPVANPATRALREGTVVGLANLTLLIRRDGSECPIDDSAAPIRDAAGVVSGSVLIFRDVTAQRAVENERAHQLHTARLLAAIVESSDDAIISKSLDGTIRSWNGSAERLFGYSAEEAIGRHISLVIPEERLAEEDQIIAKLKEGQRIDHFETERQGKDRQRIPVSLSISPLKDGKGGIIGASKIVRDVTRQRQAESDREKFVTLIESSTDFIGMCDMNGIPFFVNRAGLALVGLDSIEEARRTPVQEFFFPEDQPRIIGEFFPKVVEDGHGEIEVRFRHFKTGEARWMAYKVQTLTDAVGMPIGLATVSQDVSERKRLADDLLRLAASLSEADRRKDEFLAMLAHELRNPLAPISNAVYVLRLGINDETAIHAAHETLDRQVRQMSRLVDDLLDVSRITRGKIELRKERIALAPVIDHAIETARAVYKNVDRELIVEYPQESIYLDADPARLAQVVGNLVNNACKFTEKGGRIRVTAERDGTNVVIVVRDDGIGLAANQQSRIFDLFTQVDTSLERSRDGLGIGLTLVKTLVEMHGGGVEVRSDGLGHGSEFVVRLPTAAAPATVASPSAPREPAAAISHRVLIVDDNQDGAESLAILLQLAGHEVRTANDGFEALDAVAEWRPDAVLLDIGLPKLNGYEVCRRIRQQPWGKDLLLLATTGWGQEEDHHRSREAGFDGHIVKPIDYDALASRLASLPSRRVPTS